MAQPVPRSAAPAVAPVADRHPLKGPRYWSRRSPEGPWDYVVVGSGMGGLTAAALLGELGRRVLVLEQHYLPGGFTHAFSRAGYVWDVGVHAVGEVTHHTLTGRLLHRLTAGRLRWASLGPVYEQFHYPGGFRVDFPDHPETFRHNLLGAFPGQEAAIDRYLQLVREVSRSLRGHYLSRLLPPALAPFTDPWLARRARRFQRLTTAEVLARLTDDPRLRTVLTSQWGYYGAPPSRSSFALHALVVKHFLHGGYYPVGGAQEIGRCLTRAVAEKGGWTRIVAAVDQILVRRGRAVGVRLEGGEEIAARRVVVASGIGRASRHLLPPPQRNRGWAAAVREVDPGPAHVCLYMGFQGDIRAAGASSANKWFYDTWDPEEELWEVEAGSDPPRAPVLYTSFPSLKDPEHDPGPEQRHTGEVVTFVPWRSFSPWQDRPWQKRGETYQRFKDRLEEALRRQLLEHMPGLAPCLRYCELSTPLSTDHFCRPLDGSIYGLAATPERFANRWLRPRSPVRNLFFAGSDVTSGGVMGAFGGAVLAVVAAEPWRAWRYLSSRERAAPETRPAS